MYCLNCQQPDINIIIIVLMHGTPSEEDIQEFIIAIKSGSYDHMKKMLDIYTSSISNKLESQLRQPPLYFAVLNPDEDVSLEMVKALVEAGANPNFKDANEQTILFYVCRDGKLKLAEYLMSLGCKLEEEDLYGQTPIFYVASEDQLHMLDLFTPEMINHVDKLAKQTPLYYAVRKEHLEMCKALVKLGCNVMHLDSNKKTVADFARKHKFHDITQFLNSQIKKVKEVMKSQNSLEEQNVEVVGQKKKKKESSAPNNTKSSYKLTIMKENGDLHDLTEDELRDLFRQNPMLETLLTNPESVPLDVMEEALNCSWQRNATKILNQVWKCKGAFYFFQPVDPQKYSILDYYQVITNPMDLNSIKKKLSFNAYSSPREFIDDMSLVWENCIEYNGPDHEISLYAKQMQRTFEEGMRETNFIRFL